MHYDKLSGNKFSGEESDCAEFRTRLDAVLDARRDPENDAQLAAHGRHCPACTGWLATQMRLLEAAQTSPSPSEDFALRVLESLKVDRQHRSLRRLRRVASLAAAAVVLIAVFTMRTPNELEPVPIEPVKIAHPPVIAREVQQRIGKVAEDIKPMTGSVYTAINALWLAQRLL